MSAPTFPTVLRGRRRRDLVEGVARGWVTYLAETADARRTGAQITDLDRGYIIRQAIDRLARDAYGPGYAQWQRQDAVHPANRLVTDALVRECQRRAEADVAFFRRAGVEASGLDLGPDRPILTTTN